LQKPGDSTEDLPPSRLKSVVHEMPKQALLSLHPAINISVNLNSDVNRQNNQNIAEIFLLFGLCAYAYK
jgi:hypothetical protein